MSIYLHDVPLSVAEERFKKALENEGLWGILGSEEIFLNESALNRVLAEPVWARISSPHYHASAMDGFAVRAEDISGAMPTQPVVLLLENHVAYVDTGDPLPDWANTVVPIELVEPINQMGGVAEDGRNPYSIRLRNALPPWTNVRPMGEDIVATQLVLPAGRVLGPVDLGAIAAAGIDKVIVNRRPVVAVIPTGTELVSIGQDVKRGDIIEYNSVVLAGQVIQWGGEPDRYSAIPDSIEQILQGVKKSADQSDLILLNAGSSAGSEDYSSSVVEELGELLVHGVAIRPGHPVILGMIRRSPEASSRPGGMVPIIGVPGYPVSAALTGEIFVEPLLSMWQGRPRIRPVEVEAILTRKIASPAGDDDYVRMVVGNVGERLLAAPLSRGAGVITSLVRADGITIIPKGIQGYESGSPVSVRLYRSRDELSHTIFAIGSHDMTLDLLAQYIGDRDRRLVSSNVGSLGGLVALRRGEAHIAGSHLMDPESGIYNLNSIQHYLPDTPVCVINWVKRQQGLFVAKGNPEGISSLEDLVRPELAFINRQRGAGTRVLLDYNLDQLGINASQIRGYEQEEYTHLAVAAAVASGRADCGLGVAAAAVALNLEFIALYQEQYDLVIPCEYLEEDFLDPLFEIMQLPSFQKEIMSMPGYDVENMGKLVVTCK